MQLQHLAQKSDSDIEELIRRAKLVAMKLKLEDFETWCNSELMGYSCDDESLPEYRITRGRLYVFNPYNGLIPFHLGNDDAYKAITTIYLREAIGEFLNLISSATNGLVIQLPKTTLDYLYNVQYKTHGLALEPRLKLEVTQLKKVLTHVRNTIFTWSVNLEKSGILGEGMQFTKEEKEKAMSNTIYNIGNMQGIVGQVQESTVTQTNQMIVNKMELSTLLSTLKSVGITENDLEELQKAISEDEHPSEKNKFGKKVSTWYGAMISKAATGSWDISVAVAAGILTQVLNSFYGF